MKKFAFVLALSTLAAVPAALASAPKTASVSAASPAGTRLYTALLTTKFAPLPDGYYSANVGTDSLDSADKKHNAIGRVLVSLDSNAAIQYDVLPSWQNARDRFKEKPQTTSGVKAKVVGTVPGFHIQSKWINGSLTGKNAFGKTVTNGLTMMCGRSDAVTVCAVTVSTDNEQSGDIPGAIKLLRAGLKHLDAVRARLSR